MPVADLGGAVRVLHLDQPLLNLLRLPRLLEPLLENPGFRVEGLGFDCGSRVDLPKLPPILQLTPQVSGTRVPRS